jgi:glycosyltransferase involved in cell wall biosynthesis|tara:strand:- start:1691 stop:2368 length:678 start_codon:yes stop_codon:yes gene_type:complete
MQLTVVIPVYNEKATIIELLDRVTAVDIEKEIIVVDDFSTDGTRAILEELRNKTFTLLLHNRNQGKGAALRTGFQHASGDFVIIQDADLEYDPADFPKLLAIVKTENARVVYGSRLATSQPTMTLRHFVGNRLLTGLTNLLYGSQLTDMETCYKLLDRRLVKNLQLVSNSFNVEPEITAKLLKQGIAIHEVPISYHGRSFAEGKKISWKDFISAVWTLITLRVSA